MIEYFGQTNSTLYNKSSQKVLNNKLSLQYLATTTNNTHTPSLLKNSVLKKYSQRDTAIFSTEGLSQCDKKNSNVNNTFLLDFSGGVVGYDYMKQMYTLDDGTLISPSTIHPVNKESCATLHAENNNLLFYSNTYYNYTEVNGTNWLMAVNKDSVYQAFSDSSLGNYSVDDYRAIGKTYGLFSSLIETPYPVGLNMYYSNKEILEVMKNVGITPGKFTIGIDNNMRTFYLCKDGTILSDEQVSNYRSTLNNVNVFERGYTKDDVWMVDGVEIRPDEQGYLHIPDSLGADIEVIRSSNK